MAAAINKSFFMGVENVCKFVEIVYPVVRRKLLQTKTTLSEKSRYFHFVAGRNSFSSNDLPELTRRHFYSIAHRHHLKALSLLLDFCRDIDIFAGLGWDNLISKGLLSQQRYQDMQAWAFERDLVTIDDSFNEYEAWFNSCNSDPNCSDADMDQEVHIEVASDNESLELYEEHLAPRKRRRRKSELEALKAMKGSSRGFSTPSKPGYMSTGDSEAFTPAGHDIQYQEGPRNSARDIADSTKTSDHDEEDFESISPSARRDSISELTTEDSPVTCPIQGPGADALKVNQSRRVDIRPLRNPFEEPLVDATHLLHLNFRRLLIALRGDEDAGIVEIIENALAEQSQPPHSNHLRKPLVRLMRAFYSRTAAWKRGMGVIKRIIRGGGTWRPRSLPDILSLNLVTCAMIDAQLNGPGLDSIQKLKDSFLSNLGYWRDLITESILERTIYCDSVKRIWGIVLCPSESTITDSSGDATSELGFQISDLEELKALISSLSIAIRAFDLMSESLHENSRYHGTRLSQRIDRLRLDVDTDPNVGNAQCPKPRYRLKRPKDPDMETLRDGSPLSDVWESLTSDPDPSLSLLCGETHEKNPQASPPSQADQRRLSEEVFIWLVCYILLLLELFITWRSGYDGKLKPNVSILTSVSYEESVLDPLHTMLRGIDPLASKVAEAARKLSVGEFGSAIHLAIWLIVAFKATAELGLSAAMTNLVEARLQDYHKSLRVAICKLTTNSFSTFASCQGRASPVSASDIWDIDEIKVPRDIFPTAVDNGAISPSIFQAARESPSPTLLNCNPALDHFVASAGRNMNEHKRFDNCTVDTPIIGTVPANNYLIHSQNHPTTNTDSPSEYIHHTTVGLRRVECALSSSSPMETSGTDNRGSIPASNNLGPGYSDIDIDAVVIHPWNGHSSPADTPPSNMNSVTPESPTISGSVSVSPPQTLLKRRRGRGSNETNRFLCPESGCEMRLKTKQYLQRHQMKIHGTIIDGKASQESAPCLRCGKRLSREEYRVKHEAACQGPKKKRKEIGEGDMSRPGKRMKP